jgi:chromosome segregation ATPase
VPSLSSSSEHRNGIRRETGGARTLHTRIIRRPLEACCTHSLNRAADNASATAAESHGSHDVIISVLREQLQSKDRQIETLEKQLDRKDEQIGHQNERMREQNVLMKDLQQRLAITAPGKPADIVMETETQKGSPSYRDGTPPASLKTSIWRREFRLFGRS